MDCPETYAEVATADQAIVVWKGVFTLGLYEHGQLVHAEGSARCFPVALGGAPVGDKLRQGDEHTPVGTFRVTHKNPKSSFHLSLGVSYPDAAHARAAFSAGVIDAATRDRVVAADKAHSMPVRTTKMGGDIYIHGGAAFPQDWTDGCVGMDNDAIDLVYAWARPGTTVLVREGAP